MYKGQGDLLRGGSGGGGVRRRSEQKATIVNIIRAHIYSSEFRPEMLSADGEKE